MPKDSGHGLERQLDLSNQITFAVERFLVESNDVGDQQAAAGQQNLRAAGSVDKPAPGHEIGGRQTSQRIARGKFDLPGGVDTHHLGGKRPSIDRQSVRRGGHGTRARQHRYD